MLILMNTLVVVICHNYTQSFLVYFDFQDFECHPHNVSCAVWQWEGDDGQWNPYPPAACALLDSATSSGKASVTLSLGSGTAYKVDLKKMLQINPVTKYKRKIQCQPTEGWFFLYPLFIHLVLVYLYFTFYGK